MLLRSGCRKYLSRLCSAKGSEKKLSFFESIKCDFKCVLKFFESHVKDLITEAIIIFFAALCQLESGFDFCKNPLFLR